MKKCIALVAILTFISSVYAADVKPAPTPPAKPSAPDAKAGEAKPSAKPEDFTGKWKGKWDGTYGVQFTITPIADDKERVNVLYEWEEKLGQPYHSSTSKPKIVGNVLKLNLIEITISAEDPNRAVAKGNFARPRTAILTKEK
jgi:hypothetical protein